jgi:hypothetical protein
MSRLKPANASQRRSARQTLPFDSPFPGARWPGVQSAHPFIKHLPLNAEPDFDVPQQAISRCDMLS